MLTGAKKHPSDDGCFLLPMYNSFNLYFEKKWRKSANFEDFSCFLRCGGVSYIVRKFKKIGEMLW